MLTRNGHTEAAVDLARLTGAQPAGVICEIMNDDGTMAKGEDLQSFRTPPFKNDYYKKFGCFS